MLYLLACGSVHDAVSHSHDGQQPLLQGVGDEVRPGELLQEGALLQGNCEQFEDVVYHGPGVAQQEDGRHRQAGLDGFVVLGGIDGNLATVLRLVDLRRSYQPNDEDLSEDGEANEEGANTNSDLGSCTGSEQVGHHRIWLMDRLVQSLRCKQQSR